MCVDLYNMELEGKRSFIHERNIMSTYITACRLPTSNGKWTTGDGIKLALVKSLGPIPVKIKLYWLLAWTHAGAERIDYWHEKRSGFLYYYSQLLATISVTLIHSKSISTASGVHRCTQPDLLTWRTVMSKWKRSVPRWYVLLHATIDIVTFIRQVEGYCQHQFSSLVSSLVPVILIANYRSFVALVRCLSIRKQQGDFVTSLVAATM